MDDIKLYWKVFGIFFGAMFLFLNLVALPLFVGIIILFGDTIRLDVCLAATTAMSLLFAWAWIAALADSVDRDTRIWQFQELAKDGWKMFLEINPVGWIILLWRRFVRHDV